MANPTKSPKDGATRKREHDQRQRKQGRKPVQIWLTDNEAKAVRQFVKKLRET
jgi:hypothetical protein